MRVLNWIWRAIDRWDERRWRRYVRKNRIRMPDGAVLRSPRFRSGVDEVKR